MTTPDALNGQRAISLIQPWATLIVAGLKRYETRSWSTPYRGRILIHASKKLDKRYLARPDVARLVMQAGLTTFPTGVIVGRATIAGCVPSEELADLIPDAEALVGDFGEGRFAWAMQNAVMFDQPIECKGHLGIWTVRL